MAKWEHQGSVDVYKQKKPEGGGWIVVMILVVVALAVIF